MNPMVSFRASISFAASRCRVNTAEKSMEGGGVSALRGRKSTTTGIRLFPEPSHISGNPRRTVEAHNVFVKQRLCVSTVMDWQRPDPGGIFLTLNYHSL